ncbi:MAG: VirD4-like conjugal transfer protein, CD1115 family, partial [Paraclostridium sp.]
MDFIKQIYSVIDEKVQVFFDSKDFKFNIISKFEDKDFSIKFGVIGFIIVTLLLNIITESLNFKRFLYGSSINILSIFKFVNIIKFSLVYLIFWLIYILAYSKFLLNIKIYHGDIKDGQKGSSRFATRKEIHSQYRSIPLQRDTYSGCGGVPVARGQILVNDEESNIKIKKEVMYIDDSAVNNLIIGTTRSGKGETYIVPMIDIYSRANIKSSLVINDPKGELVAMSKEILESRGYEVFVLNIMNPDFSMSYNPLTLIKDAYKEKDFAQAQQLCNTLTYSIYHNEKSSEPMWEESSMALVNALILDLCDKCIANNEEDKITLYTVSTMLSELCKTYQSGLTEKYKIDDYFEKLPSTSVAKLQYATVNFAQGKTKGSIFVTTMSKLQKFTFDKIAKMTSKNSLDFKEIGFKSSDNDKPKAIFLVTPDYDSSLHFLASMYIQQIYYSLSVTASNGNGKCDREVIFILDEFGNMPTIQGLSSMITVCLGRRIKFNLVVQAYSQLKEKYGDQAETIEGNCGNQIYIMTNDDNTSEKFSKLIGEETITTISRSGEKFSMIKSQTESLDRRRLITSDELRRVKEGEILVVRAIKRQDVNRNKIVSYPIFNKDEYSMKYRYEYLSETFDNSKINFSELQETIKSDHKDVKLEDINFCKINKNMIEDKVNNDLEYKEVKP